MGDFLRRNEHAERNESQETITTDLINIFLFVERFKHVKKDDIHMILQTWYKQKRKKISIAE